MKQNKKNEIVKLSIEDFKNHSKEELIEKFSNQYKRSKSKFKKSWGFYVALNISIFAMSALLIIISLFAISKNETGTRLIFISISILTASIALITGISSLFQFKAKQEKFKKQIIIIENLYAKFVKEYSENQNLKENVISLTENLFDVEEN